MFDDASRPTILAPGMDRSFVVFRPVPQPRSMMRRVFGGVVLGGGRARKVGRMVVRWMSSRAWSGFESVS